MKRYYWFFLIVLGGISCNQHEKATFTPEQITSIFITPDSLLSSDIIQLKYKLGDLIFDKAKVVNNNLIINIEKEDFVKLGIQEAEYTRIMNELDRFNHWNDTIKDKQDVSAMLEESRARYLKEKGNRLNR